MKKTKVQKENLGAWLAILDMDGLIIRAERATDDELRSPWWRFKEMLYATWLGFKAPPLWTVAGRSYNRTMREFGKES